ncbi:MAG: OOP family OmpA-OmpF porin [Granulosicoccus sp.]|jgi:OOP family OmpA-OmpF porin
MMNKLNVRPLMCAALVSLALGACSSAPKPNASLEDARVAYSEAANTVTVVKHAPEELDKAQDALNMANKQWRKKESQSSVEYYAYLVKQRVRIAGLIAESNETDRELESMELERRNLTLDLREAELVKAREESLELQRQIAEMSALQAEKTDRGMVLTLGDVLFDVSEATLAPGAARNIDQIASFMQRYPEREAVIEGHTDSMGEDDFNIDLSRERAFAVRQALVSSGVLASRISTQGFGESLPVANNNTSTGRQKNRRVEIIFPNARTQVSEYDE